MNKHTTSQQLSARIAALHKERGEVARSLFGWHSNIVNNDHYITENNGGAEFNYPAYLASEVIDRLPQKILYMIYHDHLYQINAYDQKFIGDTLAEATGLLYEYLMTNKLI